jgi:Flp pilus assembly protein CpaB
MISLLRLAVVPLLGIAGLCLSAGLVLLLPKAQTKAALLPLVIAVGLIGGLFAGVLAWSWMKKVDHQGRDGWNLVPVVVVAASVPKGAEISFDVINQRSIPEQFVTDSMVRPDRAYEVIHQPTGSALEAGQPLLWGQTCEVTPPPARTP